MEVTKEIKVRLKNKVSEPLMTATDFCIKEKKKKDKVYYSLEFRVCKSMGISDTYSFDSADEKLLKALMKKITTKGEFLFDRACKACKCKKTAMDYDAYLEMSKCGELKASDLKFRGGDYVITV